MKKKIEILKSHLLKQRRIAIAISGGLDSSILLAYAVKVLGADSCLAITAQAPYMMQSEWDECLAFVAQQGVHHITPRFDIPDSIKLNPPNRCYLCKKQIFTQLKELSLAHGFETLVDGSNKDDLSDYRPGHQALHELGIVSPFLLADMGKTDIRALGKELGLPESLYTKPAYACLLTRLEHNTEIDSTRLRQIDHAESFLRSLGFKACRVRTKDNQARIEIPREDFPLLVHANQTELITSEFKSQGFDQIVLDLGGYRQGSMNIIP